ncbi:hypothetical protein MIR68_002173 [Amoeboaphelidium protococcarum]|nr:hypothetical protein MIR68_002173 [Amoeboaphelidium protococcarum]
MTSQVNGDNLAGDAPENDVNQTAVNICNKETQNQNVSCSIKDQPVDDDIDEVFERLKNLKIVPAEHTSPKFTKPLDNARRIRLQKYLHSEYEQDNLKDQLDQKPVTLWKSVPVYKQDLLTTWSGGWLNDEIINGFIEYIRFLHVIDGMKVHIMNTFFYQLLTENQSGYCYDKVKQWTRKVDISALNRVMVPINYQNYHWLSAIINVRSSTITLYDSMHSYGVCKEVGHILRRYLLDEWINKNHSDRQEDWEIVLGKQFPHQSDGSSCGVFTSLVMLYGTIGQDFDFSQADIINVRQRIVDCLLSKIDFTHIEDAVRSQDEQQQEQLRSQSPQISNNTNAQTTNDKETDDQQRNVDSISPQRGDDDDDEVIVVKVVRSCQ